MELVWRCHLSKLCKSNCDIVIHNLLTKVLLNKLSVLVLSWINIFGNSIKEPVTAIEGEKLDTWGILWKCQFELILLMTLYWLIKESELLWTGESCLTMSIYTVWKWEDGNSKFWMDFWLLTFVHSAQNCFMDLSILGQKYLGFINHIDDPIPVWAKNTNFWK